MLSAEYGGCGAHPIESGMVIEEPDIEIGQGVSSKAISRRMGTDKGGSHGPRSSRDHHDDDEVRRDRRRDDGRAERRGTTPLNLANLPAAVPGYPYMPPIVNGMPVFPPGFVFPGQAPQQPPPPGRG